MKQRNEVLVGLFITVVLALGIAGTLWLARRGIGGSNYPLYTEFAWGADLRQGQQVLLAGVQVGFVDEVRLLPAGKLAVTMQIDRQYRIPEGTTATVKTVSFFGDKAVALTPARFTPTSIQPGDTVLAGPEAASIDALLGRLDTVSRSVADIAQGFEIQMVQQGGLADLRQTIASTDQLVAQLAGLVAEQRRTLSATLGNLRRATSAIDSAAVDSTVRNIQTASGNLARMSEQLASTSARLDGVLAKVDSGGGTAARILNDPALYDNMRALLARLDSLTADIKKNPGRYINVKVF